MSKKNTVFVITGRTGTELEEPVLKKTQKKAEDWVKRAIAELVVEDHRDELEEAGVIPEDADIYDEKYELKPEYVDPIIDWGSEENICSDDTYYANDYTEYTITELEIPA